MFDFLQRNWIGIAFVLGMLAMHFGGHRRRGEGGHGGHGGMMGGCGGHSVTRPHEHPSRAGSSTMESPSTVPDPTRDAYSPDASEAGSQVLPAAKQPVSGPRSSGRNTATAAEQLPRSPRPHSPRANRSQ
jgi:hypothetical protein